MSAIAAGRPARAPSRRDRAADIAAAALRGGLVATAAAVVGWFLVALISGTAFLVLIAGTIGAAAVTAFTKRDAPLGLWGALAVGWAIVVLERLAVHDHGGVWVAAAAWLGVVTAARRARMPRWALPLLAYPLISVGLAIGAGLSLLSPWGVSWLWVAAILGPVLGVKALLRG